MIINCPYCSGPLIKGTTSHNDEGSFEMDMRCPHCKKNVSIRIRTIIKTEIFINKVKIEHFGQEPEDRILP